MATATIEIRTNQDAGSESWCDFTPDARKVFARTAKVRKGDIYVAVTELERDDPTRVDLYVLAHHGRKPFSGDTQLSIVVTERELNDLIDALTLARDTAINEWMLEPAAR